MDEERIHHLRAEHVATLGPVVAKAEAHILRSFAFGHWRGARRLADLLRDHEARHAGEAFGAQFEDARSFASSAILMAYAAMEAGLDELQLALGTPVDSSRDFGVGKVSDRLIATLDHHGLPTFKKGDRLGQNVDLLRRIRNALAHPTAEWTNANPRHSSLGQRIAHARLELSPFVPSAEPPFPLRVMSAGVASWSADTAAEFLNEMRRLANMPPVVTHENRLV